MRRSWMWQGMVFQTEPGASCVMPTTSWQVLHALGMDELEDRALVRSRLAAEVEALGVCDADEPRRMAPDARAR